MTRIVGKWTEHHLEGGGGHKIMVIKRTTLIERPGQKTQTKVEEHVLCYNCYRDAGNADELLHGADCQQVEGEKHDDPEARRANLVGTYGDLPCLRRSPQQMGLRPTGFGQTVPPSNPRSGW